MSDLINRIQIKGFRSLANVDVRPGPVTVLIGPNGSGKSNLLSTLRMIPLMRTGSLRRFVGEANGASALLHYGPSQTREIEIRLEFLRTSDGATNVYDVRLGYAAGDTLIFLDEAVGYRKADGMDFAMESLGAGHSESRLEGVSNDGGSTTVRTVRWWISKLSFFHFHDTSMTAPLRQNAKQEDSHFLRSDGSNLASFLLALSTSGKVEDQKAWTRIGKFVRLIAPYIKTLAPSLVDLSRPSTSAVRLQWADERDHVFGPHDLSDGTLRAIALITALAQPTERLPKFMTIDEPELGLHPAAVDLFASLVRAASVSCQVMVATQSPALIDLFRPEEILVVERSAGSTQFKRVDSDKLAEWLAEYRLSELYDKNVLGGRP